jgi:hypothetical protein
MTPGVSKAYTPRIALRVTLCREWNVDLSSAFTGLFLDAPARAILVLKSETVRINDTDVFYESRRGSLRASAWKLPLPIKPIKNPEHQRDHHKHHPAGFRA